MSDVVNRLWGFCHTLRHDGIDYGDYIEQLTYLLFLKMADEKGIDIKDKYNWSSILELAGTELLDHYTEILRMLRDGEGILGDIFTQAMPRFTNPVNLKKVINMIDEVDWSSMEVDVKGARGRYGEVEGHICAASRRGGAGKGFCAGATA